MLEALEDYVKRQKKRLEQGANSADRSGVAKRLRGRKLRRPYFMKLERE